MNNYFQFVYRFQLALQYKLSKTQGVHQNGAKSVKKARVNERRRIPTLKKLTSLLVDYTCIV